ncbi:(2Fe-2S)-binding protein [Roseomonas sp. NAR14]|uniref:Bacterioferritin-associated ferredoxin n=1 Tax=Roseomonas acroporae TaxID=2937791 RepID=A0A9X1Y3H9_9PROT|nr:(2Fe-2S)-binding protein [Roseomonas acroporae]MCK8783264.1 (2Fe-2S)-binding protein [Roseomonas acroporae]
MYVCLCNAITDRDVRRVASENGVSRPAEVYEACGCRAQCGRCVKMMLNMLRGEGNEGAEAALQGA